MKRKKYSLQIFVIFAVAAAAYGNKVTFDDGVCMTPGGIKQCKGKKIIASPAQGNRGKCARTRAVEMFLEIAGKRGTNCVELPELGEDEWVDENKLFFVESSGKTRTINHVSSNDLVPLTHIRIYIGRPYIKTRQLCAVESAVRNANVTVILIVTSSRLDLDANNATRQIHDLSRGQRGARPNDGVAGSLHIRTVDPIRLFARCAQINDPARTRLGNGPVLPCSDLGRAEERIASSVEATMQF